MKKRITEEQIIEFLKEADAGLPVKGLCRKHGFSEASFCLWRSKFGGMDVSDARRLKALELENSPLKRLVADAMLENEAMKEGLRKSGDRTGEAIAGADAPDKGLSERRALRLARMSASALRYTTRPDANAGLREQIVELAQLHRRYGAEMIYLKLRQAGQRINTSAWNGCTRWRSCRCGADSGRRSRRRIVSR